MNIYKYINLVFLSLLFCIKLNGQINLFEITSKSRENYQDLIFNITDKHLENNFWILTAKGQYKGTIAGIKIKFKNGLKPGLFEDGRIDNTSWAQKAVEMSTIGEESDNFVRIISELYGIKTEKAFTKKPIVFTCFSLNLETAILENGYYEFKLYFDDTNRSGLYTEIFLNMNLPEGYIEIPDKDPQHGEDFIKAMIR
ncbi:MAG: hypothetical protein JXK95_13225 [Bacteroidales bacterium]|nr:hypothetical protein [Bacteroidales bacterium]